ncbi:MAG TPA: DUF4190 domain-containing protein [Bacteroidia bacterium]|jgi:hypothetical protein
MKKILLISFTTVFFVLFLGSCSVNKRVYRDGYHIEWNHSKDIAKHPQAETDAPPAMEQEIAAADAPVEEPAEASMDNAGAPVVPPSEAKPAAAEQKKNILSRIIKEDTPEEEELIRSGSKATAFKSGFKKGIKLMMPDAEGHTLRLAIASFVLGLISLFAYYGAFVLGVLAIIFGAISLRKIKNSAGAYRGSTFAWIGLICGIVSIAIALIILRIY